MAARNDNPFDMQLKLMLIGDSGVGKTCLLLRYANDTFSPTFITTIGIDFKIKHIELDGKRIKLQIWDTAGQERFRHITTSYFRGAQGILLVYDVTDRGSFNGIRNWIGLIQQHADVHVNRILVGNKCDLVDDRVVTTEEGQALADEYSPNMQYFETSARCGINIETPFVELAREVKHRLEAESDAWNEKKRKETSRATKKKLWAGGPTPAQFVCLCLMSPIVLPCWACTRLRQGYFCCTKRQSRQPVQSGELEKALARTGEDRLVHRSFQEGENAWLFCLLMLSFQKELAEEYAEKLIDLGYEDVTFGSHG
jgi:Ras-related protein Rab-8A